MERQKENSLRSAVEFHTIRPYCGKADHRYRLFQPQGGGSAPVSHYEFDIKRIKLSREVKERLSDMVEAERQRRRVGTREYMDADFDGDADIDLHD